MAQLGSCIHTKLETVTAKTMNTTSMDQKRLLCSCPLVNACGPLTMTMHRDFLGQQSNRSMLQLDFVTHCRCTCISSIPYNRLGGSTGENKHRYGFCRNAVERHLCFVNRDHHPMNSCLLPSNTKLASESWTIGISLESAYATYLIVIYPLYIAVCLRSRHVLKWCQVPFPTEATSLERISQAQAISENTIITEKSRNSTDTAENQNNRLMDHALDSCNKSAKHSTMAGKRTRKQR